MVEAAPQELLRTLLTAPIPGLRLKGTFHANEGYLYFRDFAGGVLLGRFGLSGVFWGSATAAAAWALVALTGSRGGSFRRESA